LRRLKAILEFGIQNDPKLPEVVDSWNVGK
jgi:hypothetical protein